jgi:flagellin
VAVGASTFATGAFTTATSATANDSYELIVEDVSIIASTDLSTNTITAGEIDTQLALTSVQDSLAAAGVTFTGTAALGTLAFSKADGSNLDIAQNFTQDVAATGGFAGGDLTADATSTSQTYGALTLTSAADIVVAGNTPANAGLTAGSNAVSTVGTGTTIANTDISTVTGANAAITSIDNALTTINSSRAALGAVQNRFESVVSSIATTSENLSAARSRIQDTDFAAETAELTRTQILQQAGMAMLSQANAAPQSVLSLLQ